MKLHYIFAAIIAILFIRGLRIRIAKRQEGKAWRKSPKESEERGEAEKRRIKENEITRLYHINPNTGLPGVCHAKKGNCPYGSPGNHYETYSGALMDSQIKLEKEHKLLSTGNLADEDIKEYQSLMEEPKIDAVDEIELKEKLRNTDDVDLLMGVVEGRLYFQEGWDRVGIALQNPNLPRKFIDDVLYNSPELYSIETQRRIMLNTSLTHDDLMYAVDNSEDLYTRSIALRNPNLKDDYINDFLENRKKDLTKLPWQMIVVNPKVTEDQIYDWYSWTIDEGIDVDRSEADKITRDYGDWKVNYERNQRFNS